MQKIMVFCLWLGAGLSLAWGQQFQVGYNPLKPLVFEHPSQAQSLFFFLPDNTAGTRDYLCKAFRYSPGAADSMQEKSLSLRIDGADDRKIRRLCRASRSDYAYFAIENNDVCRVFRLDWNTMQMENTDFLHAGADERFVTGLSEGSDACVISYLKSKKEGEHLFIYKIDANGKLEKHDFPVPERESNDFLRIFKKSAALVGKAEMRPLAVEYNMEHDPESASRRPKLFMGEDVVWLAFDTESNDFGLLKLYTFDLRTNTLSMKRYDYGNGVPSSSSQGASYVYDGKIFQIASSPDQIQFAVRDLWTGAVLKYHSYGKEDSITFANSPILMPGRGAFGVEKNYNSPKKFLRRFKSFTPSIQVRRQGNDYLMCIGGYEMVQSGGGMVMGPNGMMTPGFGGMAYERVCSFYSAINATNLFWSGARYQRTLADQYVDMAQFLDGVTDEAIIPLGGKHYLGKYVINDKVYVLKRIGT